MTVGYRLWVPAVEEDQAKDVLLECSSPLEGYEAIEECPTCRSDTVLRYRSLWWLIVFGVIGPLLGVPFGNLRLCQQCGTRYKEKGPALTKPQKIYIFYWVFWMSALSYAFSLSYEEIYLIWQGWSGISIVGL